MNYERRITRPVLRREGFSIVEIIVVLAIIGVLTLILVPVVSNRVREARIKAAEADLEHIAAAMERVAVDTNYMFRFYVLDDVIGGDSTSNEQPSIDLVDGTYDEATNSLNGKNIFIRTDNFQLEANFANVFDNSFSSSVNGNETKFGWHGPYINWQRDVNDNDWPDDPWGHDYILFGPDGGMGPYDLDFVLSNVQFNSSGGSWPALADIFDRGVILSVGPDGLPGNGTANPTGNGVYGDGDDLMRKF